MFFQNQHFMFKYLFFVLIIGLYTSAISQNLEVIKNSKSSTLFNIYQIKEITFDSINMTITTNNNDVTLVDYNDLQWLSFSDSVINISTETAELASSFNPLSIFPNPSTGIITYSFYNSVNGNCSIRLYSIQGSLVHEKNYTNYSSGVYSEHLELAPGTYIISLMTPEYTRNQKVIIYK